MGANPGVCQPSGQPGGRLSRPLRQPRGVVDPNSLNPLQFRFCPPSMAAGTQNNYRTEQHERLHMYAVMVTGGKQYRVAQGETLRVEKLEAEAEIGRASCRGR